MDQDATISKQLKIMTHQEVDHTYNLIKNESLREQTLKENDYFKLVDRIQNTLQYLMRSLLLGREYEMLIASYQQKTFKIKKKMNNGKSPGKLKMSMEEKKEQTEYMLKYLLRCRNMHEAKHQIVKILLKIKQREAMLNHMEDSLDQMSSEEAKAAYFVLLKVSFRIYGSIDRLRVDHPMLNRPFIFAGWNLQNQMIKQTLNLRYNLRKRYESLRGKDQIDRILDKTGRIIKVTELTTLNKEIENQRNQ